MELNKIKLESLSTAELLGLADSFGIDIPEDLERIFIIEELLECCNIANNSKKTDDLQIDYSNPETAPLPEKYNFSYIDTVIRDPLWVYVFWEVKEQDRMQYEKAVDFECYCLRLIPLSPDLTEIKEKSFTIPVEPNDSARYIGFTEHFSSSSERFIVKLGAIQGKEEKKIASSSPFCLPRLVKNEDIQLMKENPLLRLSGIEDLPVIIDRTKGL